MSAALFGEAEAPLAGDLPVGLGRMMAGGAGMRARQGNDFYPTPAAVTRALLSREAHCIAAHCGWPEIGSGRQPVWEPCGRGGAIVRELRGAGFDTIGTDIVADPENEIMQADLLQVRRAKSRVVVTNPPFTLAAEMIRHLWAGLRVDYMALLLKSSFWHAAARPPLWRSCRPARIWMLNWRPDFLGGGAPTMEVVWCVWQRDIFAAACAVDVLGPAEEPGLFETPEERG